MLSTVSSTKRKKPQVAPDPTSTPLEIKRTAKQLRENWLASSTTDELQKALLFPRRGIHPEYVLHPDFGPINKNLIEEQLEIIRRNSLSDLELKAEDEKNKLQFIEKSTQREENRLYALNISGRTAKLEILERNFERLSKELESDTSNKIIQPKLDRILEEIKKINK